ncbi:hypothetical protein R3I93_018195 [Phoxinus phoxinus]|uniref:Uncharacterized protein n=1 Tax=Phoxinus phoxinus TaxID=58324 RepID=A0AAN9CGP1_9TELE
MTSSRLRKAAELACAARVIQSTSSSIQIRRPLTELCMGTRGLPEWLD